MNETLDLRFIKTRPERILRTDLLIAAFNPHRSTFSSKRVVDLECGHKAMTRNRRIMVCPRCTEMLRRSVTDGSEDYVLYRKGLVRDNMEWEQDPCRYLNEGRGSVEDES